MDRQILFRGFCEDESGDTTIYVDGRAVVGYWVESLLATLTTKISHINVFESDDGNDITVTIYPVITSTVGQYTGLNDKNGKKIFEGDNAKFTKLKNKKIGIVRYNSKMACFEFMVKCCDGHINTYLIGSCENIEVVGTIFDKE